MSIRRASTTGLPERYLGYRVIILYSVPLTLIIPAVRSVSTPGTATGAINIYSSAQTVVIPATRVTTAHTAV